MGLPTDQVDILTYSAELAASIDAALNNNPDEGRTKFVLLMLPPEPRDEVIQICNTSQMDMVAIVRDFLQFMDTVSAINGPVLDEEESD